MTVYLLAVRLFSKTKWDGYIGREGYSRDLKEKFYYLVSDKHSAKKFYSKDEAERYRKLHDLIHTRIIKWERK